MLYLIVLSVYLLLRADGTVARVIQWGSAAVLGLAWIGVIGWTLGIDAYRWPAQSIIQSSGARVDIVNVKIVDAPHEQILEGQNVRIENGKITQIVAASADPGCWPKIDGHGGYLVPGLIDVHVHLQTPLRGVLEDFDFMYLVESIFGDYAPGRRALLESGLTTIRDLAGPPSTASRCAARLPGTRCSARGCSRPAGWSPHPTGTR